MPIIFLDEFEDPPETEGDSPTKWPEYGGYDFENREVDDVRAKTGALSLWLKSKASGHGFCEASQAFTTERIRIWVYFSDTTTDFRMITSKTSVGYIAGNYMVYIWANSDGNLWYYDADPHDTGQAYAIGWHYFDIVHDWATDTYDAWYDGIQICNGVDFFLEHVGASGIGVALFLIEGEKEVWTDDVQIGEDAYCKVSPAQAGPMSGGVTI